MNGHRRSRQSIVSTLRATTVRGAFVLSVVATLLNIAWNAAEAHDVIDHTAIEETLNRGNIKQDALGAGQWEGDVFILPYTYDGSYDQEVGGVLNGDARRWVSQSFFAANEAEYDFLVVFTNFDWVSGEAIGLYWSVANEVQGIGVDLFDYGFAWGAEGLEGYIDGQNLANYLLETNEVDVGLVEYVLNHEIGHRWLAYARIPDGAGGLSDELLGLDGAHWSYLLDSDASYLYGSDWHDNGDGTFTAVGTVERFSDLDLYLMGMLGAEEVEDFVLLENGGIDPVQLPVPGATIEATPRTLGVADVIAAEGPRIPAGMEDAREFNVAFIYLVDPDGPVYSRDLSRLDEIRRVWTRSFFAETGGRGIVDVRRIGQPPLSGAGADVQLAIDWLIAQSGSDGGWQDSPVTPVRDTAQAILALDRVGGHADMVASGLEALRGQSPQGGERQAMQLDVLMRLGAEEIQPVVDNVSQAQFESGAWASFSPYAPDVATTSRAVAAMAAAGEVAAAEAGWAWLTARQLADGSWPWSDQAQGAVAPTLDALFAARAVVDDFWSDATVQGGVDWLVAAAAGGGLGDGFPNVAQTARFLILLGGELSSPEVGAARSFIEERQGADGSWGGSVHSTALAIQALADDLLADPRVSADEFMVEPSSPVEGDVIEVTAAVHNDGAEMAAGVPYRWELVATSIGIVSWSEEGTLPSIAGGSFVTVEATLPSSLSPGDYILRLVVDPEREVSLGDRQDDTAERFLSIEGRHDGVDLRIGEGDVGLSPGSVSSVPQEVTVSGIVRNEGLADGLGVVVRVFDGEPRNGVVLGETSIAVPTVGWNSFAVPVTITEARSHTITVVVDPDRTLSDPDYLDNRASAFLGVDLVPEVAAGALTAAPALVQVGDTVSLQLEVRNVGSVEIGGGFNIAFSYETGDPPLMEPIEVVTVDSGIAVGATIVVSVSWRPNVAGDPVRVVAEVDPTGATSDADPSDNVAETTIVVQPSTLPNLVITAGDLVLNPELPLQSESSEITARISNPTTNDAGPFTARIWLDEPGTGILLAEEAFPGLVAGAELQISGQWLQEAPEDRLVYVVVDGDAAVVEFNEDDNQAFLPVDVQTLPDLMLSRGGIALAPDFPRTGDVVDVMVTVRNIGDQTSNVTGLDLRGVGGALVDSASVVPLAGGAETTVALTWDTAGISGDAELTVEVDASELVEELDDRNNTVALTVGVQDSTLYASNRVFSPNGDGVKDTTTIYFRDPVSEITLTSPEGRLVRTLEVEPGTQSVVWDGFEDDGGRAADGAYQVTAGDYASWVEVDTNSVAVSADPQQRLLVAVHEPDYGSTPWDVTSSGFQNFGISSDGETVFVTQIFNTPGYESDYYAIQRAGFLNLEDEFVLETPGYEPYRGLDELQIVGDGAYFIGGDIPYIRWNGDWATEGAHRIIVPPDSVEGPHEGHFSVSPDGTWFVRWSEAGQLVIQDRLPGGGEVILTPDDPIGQHDYYDNYVSWEIRKYHWSEDSSTLVMYERDESRGDGEATRLIVLEFDEDRQPTLRMGGDWMTCNQPSNYDWSCYVADVTVDFDRNVARVLQLRYSPEQADLIDGANYILGLVYDIFEVNLDDLTFGEPVRTDSVTYRYPYHYFYGYDSSWLSEDGDVIKMTRTVDSNGEYGLSLVNVTTGADQQIDTNQLVSGVWDDTYVSSCRRGLGERTLVCGTSYSGGLFVTLAPAANLRGEFTPRILFGDQGVDLNILATDRNLSTLQLEYADVHADVPVYESIGLPSNQPMYGERWGTWLPPGNGDYRVRLTVSDTAGNERSYSRLVQWRGDNDIANLHTESRYISPLSSIGVLDELVFHYTVLRPANLVFEIHDEQGTAVRTLHVAADTVGPMTTVWDGLTDSGAAVADGRYVLAYGAASWPVVVDNTPPIASLAIGEAELKTHYDNERYDLWAHRLTMGVDDDNLREWSLESLIDEAADEWIPLSSGVDPQQFDRPYGAEFFAGRRLRLTARDNAGNVVASEAQRRDESLWFTESEPKCRAAKLEADRCPPLERPPVNELKDEGGFFVGAGSLALSPDFDTLLVHSSVWGLVPESLRLEYRTVDLGGGLPGPWQAGTIEVAENPTYRSVRYEKERVVGGFVIPVYWEHPSLALEPVDVRLMATNEDGIDVTSEIRRFLPETPLTLRYLGIDATGHRFELANVGEMGISAISLQRRSGTDWKSVYPSGSSISLEPGERIRFSTLCALGGMAGVRAWGRAANGLPAISPEVPIDIFSVSALFPQTYYPFYDENEAPGAWNDKTGWSGGQILELGGWLPVEPTGASTDTYRLLVDDEVVFQTLWNDDDPMSLMFSTSLDLTGLSEGEHTITEEFSYFGEEGLLGQCPSSATLIIDRTPPELTIVSPTEGEALCDDFQVIVDDVDEAPGGRLQIVNFDDQTACSSCSTIARTLRASFTASGTSTYPREPEDRIIATTAGEHVVSVSSTDRGGNTTVASVTVVMPESPVVRVSANPKVFSPLNTVGRPTTAEFGFTTGAPSASWEIEIRSEDDEIVAIGAGEVEDGRELITYAWDGRNLSGVLAPDGLYTVRVTARTACGAEDNSETTVELDATPPEIVVDSLEPPYQVGAVVQVFGQVWDPARSHFKKRMLEVRPSGGDDDEWMLVEESQSEVRGEPGSLGVWNVGPNLEPGFYELKVTAEDIPGNESVSAPMEVEVRERGLIFSFDRSPDVISPNGDGAVDVLDIRFDLVQDAVVTLDIVDSSEAVIATLLNQASVAGISEQILEWDGTLDTGGSLSDGVYRVRIRAEDPLGVQESEQERLAFIVDLTPPAVDVTNPVADSVVDLPLPIFGSHEDDHPGIWTATLSGDAGAVLSLAEGSASFSDSLIATVDEGQIADGRYHLVVEAEDLGSNRARLSRFVVVDQEAPEVRLPSPENGLVVNPNDAHVEVRGEVDDPYLRDWSLDFAPGSAPVDGDFVRIASGTDNRPGGATVDVNWDASSLTDGDYTIRLSASDDADHRSETRVVIVVDTTPPTVTITAPVADAAISDPVEVQGSVDDANPAEWRLSIVHGDGTPVSAVPLREGVGNVSGVLDLWLVLEPDGDYEMVLDGIDQAGNSSEARVPVQVRKTPPAPPVIVRAEAVGTGIVSLEWTAGPGETPVGYVVLRDGVEITPNPVDVLTYTDLGLAQGEYVYTVRSIAANGMVSGDSNPAQVVVDLRVVNAEILSPSDSAVVHELVSVTGSAVGGEGFVGWRLSGRALPDGADVTLAEGSTQVLTGELAIWNTAGPSWPDGDYELRLVAWDSSGAEDVATRSVTVDNTPPATPTIVVADVVALDTDGEFDDVHLEWIPGADPDTPDGYYLWRNGEVANAPADTDVAQPRFLIRADAFDDGDPWAHPDDDEAPAIDGTLVYFVVAVDDAGNESAPSQPVEVVRDQRRPQAVIVDPLDGTVFHESVPVTAVCVDRDVLSVQFEYKESAASAWVSLGAPVTGPSPWTIDFDPGVDGLYDVRAVASDALGPDPAPASVALERGDPAPQPPRGLVTSVDGGDVTLSWSPAEPAEHDLDGYRVYREDGGWIDVSGLLPATQLSFTEPSVGEARFQSDAQYVVRSVDAAGQESDDLPGEVCVYGPISPLTVHRTEGDDVGRWIPLIGCGYSELYEMQRWSGGVWVPESIFTVEDTAAPIALDTGANLFRHRGEDGVGNRSRWSWPRTVISHARPATPAIVDANGSGGTATLTWASDADPDLLGYEVRSDGVLVSGADHVLAYDDSDDALAASDGLPEDWALVVDGNQGTGWLPTGLQPEWSWQWSEPLFVTEVVTSWDGAGDIALAVLVDGVWMWWDESVGTLDGSTWTGRVHAQVSGVRLAWLSETGNARLNEVTVRHRDLLEGNTFTHVSQDGVEGIMFDVVAVNRWGQRSQAAAVDIQVDGDPPVGPASLTADATGCGEVTLSWSPPATGVPVAYRVYREAAGGAFELLVQLPGSRTSYRDRGLVDGETHRYRVTAVEQVPGVLEWSAETVSDHSDQRLTSTVSTAIDAGDELRFEHWYADFGYYGGGLVEISVDGGSTWEDLGTAMTQGWYDRRLYFEIVENRWAFSGPAGGWVETVVDLSAWSGTDAIFRFRLVTEPGVEEGLHWFVRDVSVGDVTSSISLGRELWAPSGNTPNLWSVETVFAHSPTRAWTVVASTGPVARDLVFDPSMAAQPGDRLVFWHQYDVPSRDDGGVVEVSIDGGGSWTDVGDAIDFGGYPTSIDASGSPIDGRMAFTGASDGWQQVGIDLTPWAGAASALIRFRMASDDYRGYNGPDSHWTVDDVAWLRPVGAGPGIGFETGFEGGYGSWRETLQQPLADGLGWQWGTGAAHSGAGRWSVTAPDGRADVRLETAAGIPLAGGETLRFWHAHSLTPGRDLATVELSSDGGSTWVDLGSLMTSGGYGSPGGFSGDSGGFVEVSADLRPWAGEEVTIRFRLVTDGGTNGSWSVDDVQVAQEHEVLVADDFSDGDNDGWSVYHDGGSSNWRYSTYSDYWLADFPDYNQDPVDATQYLAYTMPVVPEVGDTFGFHHRVYADLAICGGRVEVSIDGGATWEAVDDHLVLGRYNGLVDGLPGFTGLFWSYPVWPISTLDLSPWAGHAVQIRLGLESKEISTNHGSWYMDDVTVLRPITGGPVLFADDMNDPGGGLWAAGSSLDPPSQAFGLSSDAPHQGTWSAHVPAVPEADGATLTLVEAQELTGTSTLTFWHDYSLTAADGGGSVELSADDGATWQDLGTSFVENGYVGDAFRGDSLGYVRSVADLSSWSGEIVLLRFRLDSSDITGGDGWFIDDVTVDGVRQFDSMLLDDVEGGTERWSTDDPSPFIRWGFRSTPEASGAMIESPPSNEAVVEVACSDGDGPVILEPTVAGVPIQWPELRADLGGRAAPGSTLSIVRNGTDVAQIVMPEPWPDQVHTVSNRTVLSGFAASSDGRTLVFQDDEGLWSTKNVDSGLEEPLIDIDGWSPAWFGPNGRYWLSIETSYTTIFFGTVIPSGQAFVMHDRTTGTSRRIWESGDEGGGSALDAAFSLDGRRIGLLVKAGDAPLLLLADEFGHEISRHALPIPWANGAEVTVDNLALSDDGGKACYRTRANSWSNPSEGVLHVIDFSTGERIEVPEGTADVDAPRRFSPDGRFIVMSRLAESPDLEDAGIVVYDTESRSYLTAFDGDTGVFDAAFVDNDTLAFLRLVPPAKSRPVTAGDAELVYRSLRTGWETVLTDALARSLLARTDIEQSQAALFVAADGSLWIPQGESVLRLRRPTGWFEVPDAELVGGQNLIEARQDLNGNISVSEPIELNVAGELFPDAEVLGLTASPVFPMTGDAVTVDGVIRNSGGVGIAGLELKLLREFPPGVVEIVESDVVNLGPGEIHRMGTLWDTSGVVGNVQWHLTADPLDDVVESDESNNLSRIVVAVRDDVGVDVEADLERTVFEIGETITVGVSTTFNGSPRDIRVVTRVETGDGALVAVADDRTLPDFGPATAEWEVGWSDGSVVPGDYRVRVLAEPQGAEPAEAVAPFEIRGRASLRSSVHSDRAAYESGESALLTATVTNGGRVAAEDVVLEMRVEPLGGGVPLATTTMSLGTVGVGGEVTRTWTWSSAGVPAGLLQVAARVTEPGGSVADASPHGFTITPIGALLSGGLSIDPSVIEPGSATLVTASVENTGDVPLSGATVAVAIVRPGDGAVMETLTTVTDLPLGASTVTWDHSPGFADLGEYLGVLRVSHPSGAWGSLAVASLRLADVTPPVVELLSPSAGAVCGDVVVRARATDSASEITRVGFMLDGRAPEVEMLLEDVEGTVYSSTWRPQAGAGGEYVISVTAQDAAGNVSEPAEVTVQAGDDLNGPDLVIAGPADGSCVAGPATVTVEALDDNLTSLTVLLDGAAYVNGDPIPDGAHTLWASAEDACGNAAEETRTFVVDSLAPEVQVSGVSDGGTYQPPVEATWTITDAYLVSVEALLDGQPVVSPLTVEAFGPHELTLRGVDCAGWETVHAIGFTVSSTSLDLAGELALVATEVEPPATAAATGVATNNSAFDLEGATVRLRLVDPITGDVVQETTRVVDIASGGQATVDAVFETEPLQWQTYVVRLEAAGVAPDGSFDLILQERPLEIVDRTGPTVEIVAPAAGVVCDPVTVMANATDALSGVESVAVSVDSGEPPLAMTWAVDDLWAVEIPFGADQSGPHTLDVRSQDAAGNPSASVSLSIEVDAEAPVLTVLAPGDGACVDEPMVVEFEATDQSELTVEATLNGTPITSGLTITDDDTYVLVVRSTDGCGLETVDERTFVLDTTPPEAVVSGVEDGGIYDGQVSVEWSWVEENLEDSTALLDGEPVETPLVVVEPGEHLLALEASDCAGHVTTETIAFTIEGAPPLELSGLVWLSASVVERGIPFTSFAQASNDGLDEVQDVTLEMRVVFESGSTATVHGWELTLPAGDSVDLEHEFSTVGWKPGDYDVEFHAVGTYAGDPFAEVLGVAPLQVTGPTPIPGLGWIGRALMLTMIAMAGVWLIRRRTWL
jgi:flagellar hook assembly protein FlgD/subtilase family serine protease